MGIINVCAEMLLHEHTFKPLEGVLLSIAKQRVACSPDDLRDICRKYGIDFSPFKEALESGEKDFDTRHSQGHIHDHDFYRCFSNLNYKSLDVSDYEGADLVFDMNTPILDSYKSQFDVIVNFSSMDNIFDPANFLKNSSAMLRPGGRIFHYECACAYPGAYLSFSPEYFFSYYAVNNFVDCKAYAFVTQGDYNKDRLRRRYDVFEWVPFFTPDPDFYHLGACRTVPEAMFVMVVAEKGENSTYDKTPIQSQFIPDDYPDWRNKYS